MIDEIPGYREALAREHIVRLKPFLGADESICGIRVVPLTLRKLLLLEVIRSPFLSRSTPGIADIVHFLWAVSPDYRPRSRFRRWLHFRKCRRLSFASAVAGILAYVDEMLQDISPGSSGGTNPIEYYSHACGIVGVFAREYGWTADYTMDLDCRILFQLMKEIRKSNNPQVVLFNQSDSIRGEYLKKLNARRTNNKARV